MDEILTTLRSSASLRVEGFDERAAVELAVRLREARRYGDQREGLRITKGAMKFDRQIVAIALVSGATVLYSDDEGVARFAAGCGLAVKSVAELPIPVTQQELSFENPGASKTGHEIEEETPATNGNDVEP